MNHSHPDDVTPEEREQLLDEYAIERLEDAARHRRAVALEAAKDTSDRTERAPILGEAVAHLEVATLGRVHTDREVLRNRLMLLASEAYDRYTALVGKPPDRGSYYKSKVTTFRRYVSDLEEDEEDEEDEDEDEDEDEEGDDR